MKRITAILCLLAIVASMVGCVVRKPGNTGKNVSSNEVVSESTILPAGDDTSSTEAAPDTIVSTDTKNLNAVKDVETSLEKPAAIGEWVATSAYAPTDKVYFPINVRITKVTSQTEDAQYVQSAIDKNNEVGSEWSQIDVSQLKLPADVELCVIDYEVYVPTDFPANDWGIIAPEFSFSAGNINGGGVPSADGTSVYIGLGQASGIELEKDPKYNVGQTYSFRSVFTMVKGFEDYVIKTTTYPAGTKDLDGVTSITTYFAHK